jgi:two-component system OmpR family sensor kinase
MPIRLRLAIVMVLATAAAASVGGWIFVTTLTDRLHNSLVAELQVRADTVSQQLQEVPSPTSIQTSNGLPDLSDSQSVTQVLDRNGEVVAETGVGRPVALLDRAQLSQARRSMTLVEQRLSTRGPPLLILAKPASDGKPYLVVVGASLATLENAVSQVETVILVGGSLAVLIAGFATWLLAGAALAPVERMRREAAEISGLDRLTRLQVPGTHDEIAALAATLNDLLSRLQATLQIQRNFVAAAGHELRTPLAILKTELELAGRPGRSAPDLVMAIGNAAGETDRLVRLAEDLLLLAQSDDAPNFVHPVEVDLVPLVGGIIDAQQARAQSLGIVITFSGPSALPALADAQRFRQAVDNVLDNALRFAPTGSAVTVSLHDDRGRALIEVADEGPGIDLDYLPRAFDRFSRPNNGRDRDEGGAGLGLSIVKSIVHAHGGEVELCNGTERGTQVLIWVPGLLGDPEATREPVAKPGS